VDAAYQAIYWQLEETHWWFRGRAHLILSLLRRLKVPPSAAILEAGCSAGPLMRRLHGAGYTNITGIDLSEDAIRRCHAGGLTNTAVMDATNPRYADDSFDFLIASDVLEHIADEEAALRNWLRLLKPGGRLLVCVPAFMFLWSDHDAVNHHLRRYTSKSLRAALNRAGFAIDRAGYWNFSLFFPVAAVRLLQRALARSDGQKRGQLRPSASLVNAGLYTLLRVENQLVLNSCPFPFGVSTFAIASRRRSGA
jgi:SAM-dependent methyltransferase